MLNPKYTSAMIFAAGFGTRMGALTQSTPKPLLRLNGQALIDYTHAHIQNYGIRKTVVNAHYLADQIIDHFRDTDVIIQHEADQILDTGGGLKAALPQLDTDTVITMNADTLWMGPNPIDVLAHTWDPKHMDALLLCVAPENAIGRSGSGDFTIDPDGRITRRGDFTYASVQIIKTAAVREIELDVFSLNIVWDKLISRGTAYGIAYPAPWYDIGNQDSFNKAAQAMGKELNAGV